MLNAAILHRRRWGGNPLAAYAAGGIKPATVLDFENDKHLGTVSAFSDLTHAATSNATVIDSDGVLKWRAHNLLTYSDDLSNAAWNKSGSATVDGANDVVFTASTSDLVTNPIGLTVTAGEAYTYAVKISSISDAGEKVNLKIGLTGQANLNTEVTLTSTSTLIELSATITTATAISAVGVYNDNDGLAKTVTVEEVRVYRSDLGGMQNNPDTGDSYVPTTSSAVYKERFDYKAIATPEWRNAATSCSIPDQNNPSYTGAMYRTLHTAAVDIESLKLVYGNWYYGNETTGTMSLRVGIEYPLGSTPVRVYWGGEETVGIEPNENAVSDALTISIPAGAEFAVRTWQDNKTGGIISSLSRSNSKCIRLSLANGTDADDETLTNDTTGSNVTAGLVPLAIISEHNDPSVMLVGDSLFRGSHDDNSADAQGWAERHLYAEDAAFSNFSKAGASAQAYVAEEGVNRVGQAASLAGYFTHVLSDYGTNDIAAGRSSAQIQTDLETLQGQIGLPLVQTTIMHRTSSTDSWATTVNQTQISNPSEVDALNAALLGGLDFVDSVVDVQSIAQPSTVWEAGWTDDGVHPNETGVVGILSGLSTGDTLPNANTINYTVGSRRLLIEPTAATNLFPYSNTFSNSAWTKTNSSIAQDATGPDGVANSAWTLTAGSGTIEPKIDERAIDSDPQTADDTFSVFAKAGTARYIMLSVEWGGRWIEAVFDLQTGTVTEEQSSTTGTLTDAFIKPVGVDGWYRVGIVGNIGTSGDDAEVIRIVDTGTPAPTTGTGLVYTFAAAGTETVLLYGAQYEEGGDVTSYHPTNGTALTRAAETLALPAADIAAYSTDVSFRMVGEVTGQSVPLRWYVDANNYITHTINGDGDVVFEQAEAATVDNAESTTALTLGVNVPFDITGWHSANFVQGSVGGTENTKNATVSAIMDGSADDIQLAYSGGPLWITKFIMWNENTNALTGDALTSAIGYYLDKQGGDDLLLAGTAGQWDQDLVESPSIRYDDATSKHVMYFVGYKDGVAQIGQATADDPLGPWTKDGGNPVFGPSGTPSDPDEIGTSGPVVYVEGATEYLFYIGLTAVGYEAGTKSMCLASRPVSGGSWTRHGAIVSPQGSGWAASAIWHASPPIKRSGVYYLFFNASDAGGDEVIGYATASAVTGPWTVQTQLLGPEGSGWESNWIGDPSVYFVNGIPYMAYYGFGSLGAVDGLAFTTADDFPTGWVKHPDNPLLYQTETYEAKYAHKPFIYFVGDDHYHYYTSVDNSDVRGISVARGVSARPNIISEANDWSDAGWTKVQTTISTDATVAPNGETANKLVPSTSSAAHRAGWLRTTSGKAIPLDFTVDLKDGGYGYARVAIFYNSISSPAGGVYFDVNLATGEVATAAGTFGGWSGASAITEDIGDGWWRCTVGVTSPSGGTPIAGVVGVLETAGTEAFVGDGSSGIYTSRGYLAHRTGPDP